MLSVIASPISLIKEQMKSQNHLTSFYLRQKRLGVVEPSRQGCAIAHPLFCATNI